MASEEDILSLTRAELVARILAAEAERDARQEDADTYKAAMKAYFSRAAAAEARAAQLETALSQLLRAEYDGPGLRDCTDNDGVAYQSADLAKHIAIAETLVGSALSQSPDRESGT